ncbi:aminotransferase class V-fold PLP-dependent enzyme [Streptomyces clavuligerus]|nr:aminotransferase class V-fold PLP-dependent enzyme [Streptomyces clavuligerus]MBY6301056.1 aminotransferase class V-fold PLP-dependent enzyme [Streptomyces clavuligerus]QCS04118.1 aminotransferase class V-fold PLP-dependent enzyme [Streptomyces clavuligerus]QPJ96496.1 aminotransferase class V-fold PLP-dependent enzyme [Streptomyces clavuligerus]QPL79543.1 aminotransferase class V-fold PLP-dependent enzyme [Streptomyces clavuligerus]WDN55323.1 aminotransferase class V-fold PLP-dependent enzy
MAENVTRTDSRGAGGGPGPDGAEDPERTGRTAGPGLFARIREDEYGYLDETGHVYLDHTGAALPARRQLRAQAERLTRGVFGNPHTESPASATSTALVERARARVLDFVGADPDEYTVVFTANATAACRLVGESYPFRRGRAELLLTLDNHNSVNGLREFARARRAPTTYVPPGDLELRVCDATLDRALRGRRGGRGLFAYPAQSNFSGVHHPLEWIPRARELGWHVLLDAAAFTASNPLRLDRWPADFTVVSWYKVFGYPTGVGCLIARTEALALLRRPWFSGGTIQVASAQGRWHRFARGAAAFEDGTVDFHAIPEVCTGLDWVDSIGVEAVHDHVSRLTTRLLSGLERLCHSDGRPLIRLYGPRTAHRRGGTVAFNVLDARGALVDERIIARDTTAAGISVRTGCFCNPGAGEAAFGIGRGTLRAAGWAARRVAAPDTLEEYLTRLGVTSGGAVRASAGIPTTPEDVDTLLRFLGDTYRDRKPSSDGLAPRSSC